MSHYSIGDGSGATDESAMQPTVLSEPIEEVEHEGDTSGDESYDEDLRGEFRRTLEKQRTPPRPRRHHEEDPSATSMAPPKRGPSDGENQVLQQAARHAGPEPTPLALRQHSIGSTGGMSALPPVRSNVSIGDPGLRSPPPGPSLGPERSVGSPPVSPRIAAASSALGVAPPMRKPTTGPPPTTMTTRPTSRAVYHGAPPLSRGGPPPPTHSRLSTRPQSILRSPATTPSTIQGSKTIRLSVLPVNRYDSTVTRSSIVPSQQLQSAKSFAPKRLLDIENGTSILVTNQKFLSKRRFQELDSEGALIVSAKASPLAQPDDLFFEERRDSLSDLIKKGDISDFDAGSEVGVLGGAWRGALKRLIILCNDDVNTLRLTRSLQFFLPFQTGYESYVIGEIMQSMENGRKADIRLCLTVAFRNRNVSRILVQQMGPRYDFLWHWSTMITWNRAFDAWGRFPIVGITSFPATENFPSTRNHALASIFRIVLGQGNWLTRVITRGREGLVTDNPKNTAQNLAAESNGFELANRNQYGTYVGRIKTNEFRFAHRLPTDESIVRTFVAQPMPTMLNNGVVHVLRQLAKHWKNMLYQFSGNFAHQRMEQLNPFETLRFHMPVVLLVLSSLRGRNKWDSKVLGPMVRKLQELKPAFTAETARYLVRELQDNIVVKVSGGVASIVDPFSDWLDAIMEATYMIEEEAKQVYEMVSSVEIGIRLGHDLITQVGWKVPKDSQLKDAILKHIRGEDTGDIKQSAIHTAMTLITPRDKRTLIELVKNGHGKSRPAQLLLGRAKTLLQRELRREYMNEAIRELSKGDYVEATNLGQDEWYWLEENGKIGAYIYDAKVTGRDKHRFLHVDTKYERYVSLADGSIKLRGYVPVAEAITRAQRTFMNIELDHGKKFSYNAFMEFSYLRVALRKLVVISQFACEELDNARLNVLAEVQRSNQAQISIHELEPGQTYYSYDEKKKEYVPFECTKKYKASDPEWEKLARTKFSRVPPQSMIVIGGGPTGLMTTVHCTENVLASGGVMKLYEARDAFAKGGATYERAQIVRLDARWIAMLRYHLGTGYEDVYIPASGETDAQLGNTLPTQGFVEITIKDLENMLHIEVAKMWSKGLIQVHTDAKAQYDYESNTLAKMGKNLKTDDRILRRVDENGRISTDTHSWKVAELHYVQTIPQSDLTIGKEYGVYINSENAVLPFQLTGMDLRSGTYSFTSLQEGVKDVIVSSSSLPAIYPKGTKVHANVEKVTIESIKKGRTGGYIREELPMAAISKQKFTMDVGHTHVVEAIGKPHGSKVHFSVTTYEPYGVCCIQGLKISMGMHNFGERRWKNGILDDIRSQNDQNTRIIGDFTKMVRSAPVAQKMLEYMTDPKDKNWQVHFNKLAEENGYPELADHDPLVPKIQKSLEWLARNAPGFKRQTLQTRFFETGDNYYLGMEFTREYDHWKNQLASEIVAPLSIKAKNDEAKKAIGKFKGVLTHHIDRLWYEGVLEVIRTGDVYNPGARRRVPRLYMINSYSETTLGTLPVGESFRLSNSPKEKYEVVIKSASQIVVRNVEGYISEMSKSTMVKREGNLTRGPDGNDESKVALATFPVGHYVNHRTMRLNDSEKGYVFAFIGDEQATPHFMRYSGLTGACINAMLFNNFIKQAIEGAPFIDRFRLYSIETNWSNGEVVQRGTGANYGEDGFLRPGFPYAHGLDYLHSKVIEYQESQQDLDNILSRDWKIKMAASMVPRGMEMNERFIASLYRQLQATIFDKFMTEVRADKKLGSDLLVSALKQRAEAMAEQRQTLDYESYWHEFVSGLPVDDQTKQALEEGEVSIAIRLEQMCNQIIEWSKDAYLYNQRISSELYNQPKPVDSIVDDFAVEAQNFANSLTMSAALAAGTLAFRFAGVRAANVVSALLAGFNIAVSFATMTNSARYKIRNEEARVIYADEKQLRVLKGAYSVMDRKAQDAVPLEQNPFIVDLEREVVIFLKNAAYYGEPEPTEFNEAYAHLKKNINDPVEIRAFQRLLTTKFIVDKYHVSSYLQEYLVNIYKTLDEMYTMLTEDVERDVQAEEAKRLFSLLTKFKDELEPTLQRGPTRYGFVKERKVSQWDAMVVIRYLYSLMCCAGRRFSWIPAPIATKTLGLVRQTQHVSGVHKSQILRREIRDLETLFWATRESDIASLIFMTGFCVFVASILFTIARVFSIRILEDVAFWATLASTFGAFLAFFHFVRKLKILVGLYGILGKKAREGETTDDRDNVRKIRRVTGTQILLTVMRLLAALAASVALPWSVAVNGYSDKLRLDPMIPTWIAVGAVCMAVASVLFFFIVEYVVRYNLSPKLGEFVCESFRGEIENMYQILSLPQNTIDTKQVQERETWEYVAREFLHIYRFDAVFAADRFGSILQYIQSGLDPRD